MKGVLLAGGHGTRLRPLTYTGNKHMLPVANKPILWYGLKDLKEAGISEIAIILGPIKEGVEEFVGDGSKFGVNVTYINQPEPKGIAHAISLTENFIDNEPFVVYLGDNILKGGIKKYVEKFKSNEEIDELLLLYRVKDKALARRFGTAEVRNGKVIRVIEKPKEPTSDLTMPGVYFFRPIVFDAIRELKPSERGELEITEAIQKLIDWGCNIVFEIVEGWWKDTGTPEDILDANRLVLDDLKPDIKGVIKNSTIRGRVVINENTIIENSVIKGPLIIGNNCRISNAYIGPYTSVGNNCIIESTEIEDSIIMDDTKIIGVKRIIDSLIGKKVVIRKREDLPMGRKFIIGDSSQVIV